MIRNSTTSWLIIISCLLHIVFVIRRLPSCVDFFEHHPKLKVVPQALQKDTEFILLDVIIRTRALLSTSAPILGHVERTTDRRFGVEDLIDLQ